MVDTGAKHLVLLKVEAPMTIKTTWVQGAMGTKAYQWTTQRLVNLRMGQVTHSFLVIPECPYSLLGQDLLSKMRARVTFLEQGAELRHADGTPVRVLLIASLSEEYRLHQKGQTAPEYTISKWLIKYPQAWAGGGGEGLQFWWN